MTYLQDPTWVITETVRATIIECKESALVLLIERIAAEADNADMRQLAVVLTFTPGQMLTNGTKVDVGDDYTSYLAIADEAETALGYPAPGSTWVSSPYSHYEVE